MPAICALFSCGLWRARREGAREAAARPSGKGRQAARREAGGAVAVRFVHSGKCGGGGQQR